MPDSITASSGLYFIRHRNGNTHHPPIGLALATGWSAFILLFLLEVLTHF